MTFQYLLFPGFKDKAVTLSYDDGMRYDIKLIDIISRYGVKGTFNLCSGLLKGDNRVHLDEIKKVYIETGNEVAVHGKYHHTLTADNDESVITEIMSDRQVFEKELNTMITGMAYANGGYDDRVVDILKKCGIEYSRTVQSTNKFIIEDDFLRLKPTCHHNCPNLFELVDEFLNSNKAGYYWGKQAKWFYLWGHSYEFNNDDNWDRLEEFCKRIGGRNDIWYATNIEIIRYINAYKMLKYSFDGETVYNPTCIDIYLRNLNDEHVLVPSGKTVKVN